MNKGIYVFTTRNVMIERLPILKVVCDEDGDWQFFAKDDIPTFQNALLVSLAYIIHSGFISGYQNRYGDNLKPPTNVYHRMTA